MCPRSALTRSHHIRKASTHASLVSCDPKSSINAPVAMIRMPKGTSFCLAGGSWSHPLVTSPSEPVRVFPPTDVLAQGHLGLRVHGDLQRRGVGPGLLACRRHVGED